MTVIQHRRGTTTEWAASSYILEAGEIGLDTTLMKIKIGDGTTAWSGLDFIGGADGGLLPTGGLEGQILSKTTDTDYDAQWIDNFAPDTRILVKNDSGVSLAKGTPVMAVGATGDRIRVAKAVADGSVEPRYMLGVMFETVANGSEGYLTLTGEITNLNTSAYTIGDILYIDPNTPGTFTTTAPSSPDLTMAIAIVTRVNASSGRIFVRMWDQQSGLHEQHDVLIDTPADNEVLAYDSTSGLWKNQTASEAGLATPSDITTAIANLVDSAPTTLDTLNELAAALGDDPSFATTVTTALGNKQPLDADLTAIAALTGTSGFLKKTAANTWTLDTTAYTTNTGTVTSVGMTVPTGLSITGSPITTSGTLALSLASGYSIPTTAKQTEWDTAYTDRLKWDGGSTGLDAATARTSLGLVIGTNVQAYDADLAGIASATLSSAGFLKTNGSGVYSTITDNSSNWNTAYTDRLKWDGDSTGLDAATGRASLGLGTMATETATSYYAKTPTSLGGSEDLNTKTTAGLYHQNANADAATGTNYPVAQAGMLTVHVGEGFIYQQYQTYGVSGANKIYHRGYYNNAWSAWREVVTTDGATFTGAVALNGGFSVDSTAFSVADTSGNTSIGGTLGVTGATTLTGSLAANGGITGAAAKNMTVASLMPSSGTSSTGVGVIMVAATTSAAPPSKRPNNTDLVAGDVWISW